MTGAQYTALLGLWIAGIVVPGPDIFLILRNAFLSTRRNAVFTVLGVMVGNFTWITLSLMGVTVLISGNPVLKLVVQVAGALFLARMGYGAIRTGVLTRAQRTAAAPDGTVADAAQADAVLADVAAPVSPHGSTVPEPPVAEGTAAQRGTAVQQESTGRGGGPRFLGPTDLTPWRALVQGIVTNLANAKAIVFFVALFGSLVPADIPWWEALTVLGMLVAVGLAWFLSVAWVGSVPALADRFQARTAEVETVSGVVFLLVAAGLLVEVLVTA
ncbi:LysE family translocator [Kocuria tytonis]|uniref:LysE family translocator n=1 Tax=Kocuria tytonis TaxID=2054280 RepID=A0A495ABN2_9MICC|nr:LysE family translocator [Kocuria tytonis]RKQ36894.1 LysE family translocator [Kocuria tytonis]